MKALFSTLSVVALAIFVTAGTAEDKAEEVKLKGKILCCKCHLKKADKCATAIQVKKDDKTEVYVFDKESHEKYHDEICKKAKDGEVTGTVKKDGEKMIITVKSLKFAD